MNGSRDERFESSTKCRTYYSIVLKRSAVVVAQGWAESDETATELGKNSDPRLNEAREARYGIPPPPTQWKYVAPGGARWMISGRLFSNPLRIVVIIITMGGDDRDLVGSQSRPSCEALGALATYACLVYELKAIAQHPSPVVLLHEAVHRRSVRAASPRTL
ncbi:hypothetical protein FA13DRAFT_1719977 [Coprinellus micaceus]|uniref:Uncharacterized protein n=1 Tax=Coprinellus micaceus TaxID=71717 RepID=A0A4Y7SA68_COPMI|nr:hypothetical protein FA13DRAFT_1719977 [Coprinellus micaceus]